VFLGKGFCFLFFWMRQMGRAERGRSSCRNCKGAELLFLQLRSGESVRRPQRGRRYEFCAWP
jgi:hypothetical protein